MKIKIVLVTLLFFFQASPIGASVSPLQNSYGYEKKDKAKEEQKFRKAEVEIT